MTLFELLSRLRELGVRLWLEGGELCSSTPMDALPGDVQAELATQRADVIDFLAEDEASAASSAPSSPPVAAPFEGDAVTRAPRDGPLPQSFAQSRFWFLCELGGDSSPYNLTHALRLRGALDAAALAAALGDIVARHEILRTTFELEGDEPVQVVHPARPLQLATVDLTTAPDPDAAIERVAQDDAGEPCDLRQGPLLRLQLLRLGPADHVLLFTMLHMVTDGLSFGLLFAELSAHYEARRQGAVAALPELPVQYADFAVWQRRWYAGQGTEVLGYWRQKLANAPVLDLPTDRPRPPTQTFHGTRFAFSLEKALMDQVKSVARQEGCTFFMAALTTWQLLLSRYTGQADLTIGTPVSGRDRAELEPLIGLFLNTLVLRTDLAGAPSFREALRRVRQTALEAFEHADMPFEQLVIELKPERDLSRPPLFQVLFSMTTEAALPKLGDLDVEILVPESVRSMFDLTLFVGDRANGDLTGAIEYNADLFDAATIERMAGHLRQLFAAVVAEPDRPYVQLPLLAAAERRDLLAPQSATTAEYPRERTFSQMFGDTARRRADQVAVRCGEANLTYADLEARANRLAHHLRALGAAPGALVGVCVPRSIELLVALLAVQKSGAAYVPLDPIYPAERIAFIAEDADLKLLISETSLRDTLPTTGARIVWLDADRARIDTCSADPLADVAGPTDLAYVIFTSGSTGKPKGVQIEHRALLNFLTSMAREPGCVETDVMLAVTTVSFDIAGLELYLPLLVGGQVVIATADDAADGARLATLIDQCGVSVMQATPATWQLLFEAQWAGQLDLTVLCGGEAFPRELAERLLPRVGSLYNMYGPTETTIWSLVARVGSGTGPVPLGAPIANTEVYLLDAHGELAPPGVPGRVFLGGDGLARGYWRRPELTAEKFVAHPFRPGERVYDTGDLARWRNDGALEFLGRVDHQVKVRGFRIELGEIEQVLLEHAAVAECAVVPIERAGGGQLVAFMVPAATPADPADDALAATLREHLKRTLPDYMVPALFVALDALPLTPNGKVDRKELMARDVGRAGAAVADYVAPSDDAEATVAAVWQELLGVERVGRHDNFFDLGGHSLLIMRLRRVLQERLGVALTLAEVFQFPTVAAMAAHLAGGAGADATFAAVRDRARRRRQGSAAGTDAIAIVGMAARLPTAPNLAALWQLLAEGREGVSRFSDEEILAAGEDPELLRRPEYVKARAILENVELFDAPFFGVPAREAEAMDPQHRLLLECAWEALEDAGYDPQRAGSVGVFAGCGPNTYLTNCVMRNPEWAGAADAFQLAMFHYGGGALATRVAYKLDLKGPAVEVQTACSTSLVAVIQACRSLRAFECDMALAGGVSIGAPRQIGYVYQEGLIFSPDGHCRPFDAKAQGTLGGEGVGVIALKRLRDAMADGDPIRAVVLGGALNNDGSNKVAFTAPSVDGQAEVIVAAHADAGVEAASISYVETHGTATPMGDPIEVAALTKAFAAAPDGSPWCALSALKSNFGHTDAAAGIAGLIKAVLSLEHEAVPPTVHYEAPNPEIDFGPTPFFVNASLRPWPRAAQPRRCGVSSFGFGGTNAHVVLEEAPARRSAEPEREGQVVLVSAKSAAALDRASRNLADHLARDPTASLADVAWTTQVSRGGHAHRRAVVGRTATEIVGALRGEAPARLVAGVGGGAEASVAFLFPGQGAQYPGMGRNLHRSEPVFREAVDQCAELLRPALGIDLRVLLDADADDEAAAAQLQQTRLTQPAVFVVEYALAQLWRSWGVPPAAMAGHSIGEFVAATLAGVFALPDALELVAQRGRLMQELPSGDMLSIGLAEPDVVELLRGSSAAGLSLAAVNGPQSCVVSGPAAAVARLRDTLESRDVGARVLHTSHAFHSAMMEPIVAPFVAAVAAVERRPATVPCVSTVTGDWVAAETWQEPRYWGRNLREPVRFADAARTLLDDPARLLLEVGPGTTLSALSRQQAGETKARVVASMRHPTSDDHDVDVVLGALARLWLGGAEPDWKAFQGTDRQRVALPTYPFERQRYWVDPVAGDPGASAARPTSAPASGKRADRAAWFSVPVWRPVPPPPAAGEPAAWLVLEDDAGLGAAVVEVLQARGEPVLRAVPPGGDVEAHRSLLRDLRAFGRPRCVVVHCGGVWRTDAAAPLARVRERGFDSLVALARAGAGGDAAPPELLVVTNDLRPVAGRPVAHPERAMVFGPATVLPQEQPGWSCRLIDVALDDVPGAAAHVVGEAAAPADTRPVAWRRRQRWVQGYEPYPLPAAVAAPPSPSGGAWLVAGGLGGVGLALAGELVRRGARRLVLTGRTALPPAAEWDAWLRVHDEQERTSRRIRAVRALQEQGADVLVAAADVTSAGDLRQLVNQAKDRFGGLRGVVHAAGTIAHHPLDELDGAVAQAVLAPKVEGTLALAEALRDEAPEMVVLASSISTALGGLGLADYVAGNAVLDAVAEARSADTGTAWVAIAWDAWADAGFAVELAPADETDAQRAEREATLKDAILAAEGADCFGRILAAPSPQIVVSPSDLQARLDRSQSLVGDHEADPSPTQPPASSLTTHDRPELSTDYAEPRNDLERDIAEVVEELLALDRVGIHDNLFELGFDSLIGHRMIGRLKARVDMAIPLRTILESPTVAELAEYVEVARWARSMPG
ncbi:MAG: amino acid adenylation domain-containing protein [Planctomycetota bacterium]